MTLLLPQKLIMKNPLVVIDHNRLLYSRFVSGYRTAIAQANIPLDAEEVELFRVDPEALYRKLGD